VSDILTNGLVTVGCNMNKETLYKISWTQSYPELEEQIAQLHEYLIEQSEYKEANEVIERIKKL
jgi:hypothetical protein